MSEVAGAFAAGILVIAGALLLYAAAPHQRLLSRARPRRMLLVGGGLSLSAALLLLLAIAGPATAVFILLTLAMLVWSIVPLAVAWWRRPRKRAR